MVLDQHDTSQLGAEMPLDAAWQRVDHSSPVRGQPTLAAVADDMRTQHDILHDEVLVALESRTWWNRRLDNPLLVDDPFGGLVAATTARRIRRWFGTA